MTICIRHLVSYSILNANGFKKLVEGEWVLRRMLYDIYISRI